MLLLSLSIAATAAAAIRTFNQHGSLTLVGSNATAGNATFGSGGTGVFAISGPSLSALAGVVSLSRRAGAVAPGQEHDYERYIRYSLDLQP